jgi:hypothetical protein
MLERTSLRSLRDSAALFPLEAHPALLFRTPQS